MPPRPRYVCRALGILAVLVALAGVLNGCQQQTPLAKVTEARRAYTSTLITLTSARKANLIGDADARQIEAVRKDAAAALDLWESSVAAGETVDGSAVDQFNAALDKLIEWAATTKGRK